MPFALHLHKFQLKNQRFTLLTHLSSIKVLHYYVSLKQPIFFISLHSLLLWCFANWYLFISGVTSTCIKIYSKNAREMFAQVYAPSETRAKIISFTWFLLKLLFLLKVLLLEMLIIGLSLVYTLYVFIQNERDG